MPEKSGLPSGVRRMPVLAFAEALATTVTGFVPGTVTVTVFVNAPALNV